MEKPRPACHRSRLTHPPNCRRSLTICVRCKAAAKCPLSRVISHARSEEHTSELQSRLHLVCRLLLEKKKKPANYSRYTPTQSTTVTSAPRPSTLRGMPPG